jgi:putative chitinase
MSQQLIDLVLQKNPQHQSWSQLLSAIIPNYNINNNTRIAHFLAQICHESNYCQNLAENLNYSSDALLKIWPKHFNKTAASQYGRSSQQLANQQAIANIAYANRMGNGDFASGDGYKYRGRGLIQITGKNNYHQVSQDLFGNNVLLDNPDLLASDREIAIKSACWFWQKHNLNDLADQENIIGITKTINGGLNGIEDRKHLLANIEKIFAVTACKVDLDVKFSLPA